MLLALSPAQIMRGMILPYESAAIREYWKVCQLMARLMGWNIALPVQKLMRTKDNFFSNYISKELL